MFFFVDFRRKMCIFVSRPMKVVTFLRKNGDPAKRVVDFRRERDTFQNKIMEIVEDFDEKSYNNNGNPWKSSRILRVKPIFFIFRCSSFFFIFLFLIFFIFSFFRYFFILNIFVFFHFSMFFIFSFFIFLHVSSFFFFFSFSFSFMSCSKFFFFWTQLLEDYL